MAGLYMIAPVPEIVAVAGGTGSLGSELTRKLLERGRTVRLLSRRPGLASAGVERRTGDALVPASLSGFFEGASVAVSCLGAAFSSDAAKGRAGFMAVDVPANANLIRAAKAAGVKRFVYVSVFMAPEHPELRYLRAHAEVEALLKASGLDWGIVRPTGFFTIFEEYLQMAARGALPLIGDPAARTNPIHPKDVAAACAELVEGEPNQAVDVGGPEVLTRLETVRLAFAAIGKPPRVFRIPSPLVRGLSMFSRPFHPRMADVAQFAAWVCSTDFIAPAAGSLRLGDYLRERAFK
jgi:uncharacterized protein YbjT (DUF2867 family)